MPAALRRCFTSDLSHASRAIAEARAEARSLTNIRFLSESLLDAPKYGPFDYIDCCGVLHSRDRPYLVHELAKEVDVAGLRLVTFIEPIRYDPFTLVSDPVIREKIAKLSWLDRCAFAELLSGDLIKHICYCVSADNKADTIANTNSESAIPVMRDIAGPDLAQTIAENGKLRVEFSGKRLEHDLPKHAASILRLVDGSKPLQVIHQQMEGDVDWIAFQQQFTALYAVLNRYNKMMTRYAPPT
jgi:hypothetical protein